MKEGKSELNRSVSTKCVVLISFLMFAAASAENVETTVKGRKTLTNIVESVKNTGTSSKLCIFQNEVNSWCFNQLTPMVKVGWDFKQVFGTDTTAVASAPIYYTGTPFTPTYYRISLRPYVDS